MSPEQWFLCESALAVVLLTVWTVAVWRGAKWLDMDLRLSLIARAKANRKAAEQCDTQS